jgi:hypothetical protein
MIDWAKVHLYIGIPSKRGIMHECVAAIQGIKAEIEHRGGTCRFGGSRAPLLCLARGVLMLDALNQPEMTHYLALDDDLMISGTDICRMIEADFPVVGAAYRIKYPDKRIQFVALFSPEQMEQEPIHGTLEMQRIGGGLILYQRGALELLRLNYGVCSWGGAKALPVAIECVDDEGTFLTEDYATCDRWRKIGGSVRMMLDCGTDHIDANGDHYPGSYIHIWKVRHELLKGELSRYNVLMGVAGAETPPEPSTTDTAVSDLDAELAVKAAQEAVQAAGA